jgi:hypothetical protein
MPASAKSDPRHDSPPPYDVPNVKIDCYATYTTIRRGSIPRLWRHAVVLCCRVTLDEWYAN